MRIHLAQRMDTIAKKVILRSRVHHSLHIEHIEIQSQMNQRVHIIDFHIGGNNHSSQILRHRNNSNQDFFQPVTRKARRGTRWDGYLETLADHSQQPTGSPSMSTLPPSKS